MDVERADLSLTIHIFGSREYSHDQLLSLDLQ